VLVALALAVAGLVLVAAGRASGTAAAATGGQHAVARLGPGAGLRGFGGFRHGFGGAGGTLTAIGPSSLTVRGWGGQTATVATTSSTAYYRDTVKVARSDLKVGDQVAVNVVDPLAGSPTAGAVRIVLPSVAGTVSDVQDGSFTLTDRAGFRHVVHTGSATTYGKDGQSSNRAAVVTGGAAVRATGTVDANGSDFTATSVDGFTRSGPGRGFGPGGFRFR
jgi:hypothetical protein